MKLTSPGFAFPAAPTRGSRRLIAAAVLALCAGHAMAVDPFKVRDIRVEGIQRIEAGTVFNYLPVAVGETYTDDKGVAAIKALYATGFFKDVRLEVEGDVLVILLDERPSISKVEFVGAKEFDSEQLTKAMKDIGLGEAKIFDRSLLDRSEQELKKQYLSRGLYGVQVSTTVTPIERNRVNVTFTVDEGDVSRIRDITIVGAKAIPEKELKEYMDLRTPGWFTWYTKADQYSKQKLQGDLETLKSYYLNRGYIEMSIDSTQVSISPDKKDIYITINITEGEKYKISGIKLEGEMFGREQELRSLVLPKVGSTYSQLLMTETTKRISDRLGTFGYAFANVTANPEINREKKEVDFTILVDAGKRVYVRRINIAGNNKTRDEVLRREFRQFENSWYDAARIKLSKERVERLGYFKDVNMDTPEVPNTYDQVDVSLSVTEKPTGNLTFGAGYSSLERLTLTGSIQQQNAFGSGNTIGLEINTSQLARTIAVQQITPFFTDDGVSRAYEVFVRTARPPLINAGDYKVQTMGGSIRFGVPFTEYDTVFFGVGLERTKIDTYYNVPGYNNSPPVYLQYVKDYGNGVTATTNNVPFTIAWQRDSRDSVITPTLGRMQRINIDVAPIGDQRYWRATYQGQIYYPLARWVTLALNGEVNYGRGLNGKPYPLFKNFYAGGIGSIRGFESSSLGPRSALTNDPLGGATRLVGNAELQFPFPGSGNDKSLRWFFFLDGGNVFAEREKVRVEEFRYGAGIGISWLSPVGPLKLSYGNPFRVKDGDRTQRFQFQMGTGF